MTDKIISHYRIFHELGHGGMGVVYKAEDTKLRRIVALKFLPDKMIPGDEEKIRFIHEAQAAAGLNHPNICTIYGIDESEGQQFIAMEFVEGMSLKEKVGSEQLSVNRVMKFAIQIAEGLQAAHEKGIIHRDMKCDNVMVSEKGIAKIMDFGLAKLQGRTQVTKEGNTLGTISYMSPEQARGGEVDHRTDIWSFGVMLYEMLTSELPFKGEYEQAVVYSILNEEPLSILDQRKGVVPELVQVVEKMLIKELTQRYQSVEELLADMRAISEQFETAASKTTPKIDILPSIAVLPFVNMSADPEQEYFCDGMAEELINVLTRIKSLHVPARTSAFAFKGEKIDVREIGRKLNVATILEGSVRKAGNRLRITAQLINVVDGYHLWSERFDRELDDVFVIQDEISEAIVDKLKVKLLSGEKDKIVKRYTDNLEAYSLYLKGRYYWNSLTPEGWQKSHECYQQAIAIDPNYALAYVGLSIWHGSLAFWGDIHPHEAFSQSREQALKAMELDDSISDVHSLLGVVYWFYDWNPPEAQREYQRSIELEPTNAYAHLNFAISLSTGKAYEKALEHAKKVQQLDPISSLTNTWAASILCSSGQYETAIHQIREIIASDPDQWQPYYYLSVAYIYQGKFDEAISIAKEAVKRSGGAPIAKTFLGCACALAGQKEKAREQLSDLLERCSEKYIPSMFLVWLYISLQEIDEAYIWLEKGVQDHDPWLWFYGSFPGSIRTSDPRFDKLMKKSGLVYNP